MPRCGCQQDIEGKGNIQLTMIEFRAERKGTMKKWERGAGRVMEAREHNSHKTKWKTYRNAFQKRQCMNWTLMRWGAKWG